jgi:RHS repeat-associated protein
VYDPYGQRTIWEPDWSDEISWANSKKNEILFTGHRLNPESGLYYAGARYYDPVLGRWISWDPSGYDDGMNLTEYAGGRPTVSRDALGLARTPDFKGALMKRIKRSDIDENRIHLLSGDSEKTCEDSSVGDVAKGVLTYTSEPHVLENARWLKWYIYRACKVEVSLTCKCAKYELPLLGWTIWTSYSWAGDEASVSVVSAMFVTVYEKYDVGLEERDVFDRLQGYEDTLHRGAEVGSNLESWVPIVINPLEGAAMMALDALVSEQVERVDLREFAGLKPKQRMVVRRLSGDEAKRECLGPIGLISGDSE